MGGLTNRRLDLLIEKSSAASANPSFPDSTSLTGHRVVLDVTFAGQLSQGHGEIRVYGVNETLMESLTSLNWDGEGLTPNYITVKAGSSDGDMKTVFKSDIYQAMPDYSEAPNVPLVIVCSMALTARVQPQQKLTFNGATDVSMILSTIISNSGYSPDIDDGITGSLTDQTIIGSSMPLQIDAVRKSVPGGFAVFIDTAREIVSIWPHYQPKKSDTIIMNSSTGLIGWPRLTFLGVDFDMMFDPALQYGSPIEITSQVKRANGAFYASQVTHHLESNLPGGKWFSTVSTVKINGAVLA